MNKEQDGNIYYYYVPSVVYAIRDDGTRRSCRVHNYVISGYELIIDKECMEMLDDMIYAACNDYNYTGIFYMDDIESVSITGVYESGYVSNVKWLETDV